MKILFLTRNNLVQLGGGDRIQLYKTKEALERRGHTVTVATKFVKDLASYDVVHLFNMQINPHSLLVYALWAKKQGKPVALATIYWNPKEWRENTPAEFVAEAKGKRQLLRYPFPGVNLLRIIGLLLTSPELRQWLGIFLRHPGGGVASDYVKRQLIKTVDIILPNGVSEQREVERDFGTAKRAVFVPNGVEAEFDGADPAAFAAKYKLTDFVLSVGRVESRKNALALVKAAKKLDLPLVMIGNDQVEPGYGAAVKAAAGPKTIFIPEMDHDSLGSAYAAAKVHALASWFETPGLSSLEAALCGANIVTTDRGTVKEYFADLVWYCDPKDQPSIEKALTAAMQAPKSDKLRQHLLADFTWDKTSEVTEQAYRQIMEPK